MIEEMDRYTWRKGRYPRRFNRGSASCHYCKDGNHHRCCPRFDNRLCTCSCPIAEGVRAEASLLPPHLSEQEKVQELARRGLIPRTRATRVSGEMFPGIDRQQIAEENS